MVEFFGQSRIKLFSILKSQSLFLSVFLLFSLVQFLNTIKRFSNPYLIKFLKKIRPQFLHFEYFILIVNFHFITFYYNFTLIIDFLCFYFLAQDSLLFFLDPQLSHSIIWLFQHSYLFLVPALNLLVLLLFDATH